MKIQFELENDCYYAVADNVVYNDQLVDSLWFAEIEPGKGNYIVRWDENYSNKIEFPTLQEAKEYILCIHHRL